MKVEFPSGGGLQRDLRGLGGGGRGPQLRPGRRQHQARGQAGDREGCFMLFREVLQVRWGNWEVATILVFMKPYFFNANWKYWSNNELIIPCDLFMVFTESILS